jgi:hypothetical protein
MLGLLCHTDIGPQLTALLRAAMRKERTQIVAPAPQKGKFEAFGGLK